MYLISYFFFSLYAFQRKSSNTFRNEPAIAAKRLIQPSRPLSIGTFMKCKITRHTTFVNITHAIQKITYTKVLVLLVRKLFLCLFLKKSLPYHFLGWTIVTYYRLIISHFLGFFKLHSHFNFSNKMFSFSNHSLFIFI